MANCPSNCTSSVTEILEAKLDVEIATFIRLSQVAQAFGGSPTVVPPTFASITCTSSKFGLLSALLTQKQANFDMLQQVLLAA